MAIHFLTYHAKPTEANEESSELGGAYINCYIEATNIEEAEKIAKPMISGLNWQIIDVEEAYELNREDINESSEGLKYFEQALVDKEVYVLHTYPAEEQN
jgi:hypothetical protein